jgi:hypothetical protein
LTQRVWPESPAERARAEIARLAGEMARRYQRLVRRRCVIEQLRGRLEQQTRRIAGWSGPAGDGPLSLEGLRQAMARNRERLQRQLEAYDRQRDALDRCKELRRRLERGEVVVAADLGEPGA